MSGLGTWWAGAGGRTKIRVSCSPRLRFPSSLLFRAGLWCTAHVQEAPLVAQAFLAPSRAGLKACALRSATLVGENRPGWARKRDLHRTLRSERFEYPDRSDLSPPESIALPLDI